MLEPTKRPVPAEHPRVRVRLFFPARPEIFAYLAPEGRPFYRSREEELTGRFVWLDDIPTESLRETLPDWFFEYGGTLVHKDGTPYTDAELDERTPDHHAINERLDKTCMRRLSYL